jgi:hypothetical protein
MFIFVFSRVFLSIGLKKTQVRIRPQIRQVTPPGPLNIMHFHWGNVQVIFFYQLLECISFFDKSRWADVPRG